jgi:hypothetical protein
MGGSDEPSNLIELTVEEHAEEHKKLFLLYGKHDDYVAWKALSGVIGKEELISELCRLGGLQQGKINSETGHMKNIQKIGASIGGKRSAEVCREKQTNAFFNPELRLEIAKLGGKAQGKINSESGHLKNISKLSKRNTGMFWITNGCDNKMIKTESEMCDGWHKGKTQKRKI